MIKCDNGKITMEGTEASIVADFIAIASCLYKNVLMKKYSNKHVCNEEITRMINQVIKYNGKGTTY